MHGGRVMEGSLTAPALRLLLPTLDERFEIDRIDLDTSADAHRGQLTSDDQRPEGALADSETLGGLAVIQQGVETIGGVWRVYARRMTSETVASSCKNSS